MTFSISFTHHRQYFYIYQDDEMPPGVYTRPTPGNAPCVFRLEEHHFTRLDRAWQEYWFSLNRGPHLRTDWEAWISYTGNNRAVTNDHGIYDFMPTTGGRIQVGKDYIGMSGMDLPDPAIATLIFGRNVLCGREMVLTDRVGPLAEGTWVLEVETMRAPDMSITHQTHPHLVHIMNVIMADALVNGLRQVNPFHELGGRQGQPVYMPVISSRQMYYPLDRLRKLPLGSELPSVYNPS